MLGRHGWRDPQAPSGRTVGLDARIRVHAKAELPADRQRRPEPDDTPRLEIGALRELTEYLARTSFPEIAVPQATADVVDVAATGALGGRSPAEAAARQDAFWETHDALFAD